MGTGAEQDLISELMQESVEINGVEVRYIPRQVGQMDDILLEDRFSEYIERYPTVMYFDSFSGFEGEGDFFSRFGFEARDELYLTMHKAHWEDVVERMQEDDHIEILSEDRPMEKDLVYIPMVQAFFEVTYVDNEDPFFQLGDFYVFNLKLQRFTFSYENIDVEVDFDYDKPDSGDDPFGQNKKLEEEETDNIDFSDPNILAGRESDE